MGRAAYKHPAIESMRRKEPVTGGMDLGNRNRIPNQITDTEQIRELWNVTLFNWPWKTNCGELEEKSRKRSLEQPAIKEAGGYDYVPERYWASNGS